MKNHVCNRRQLLRYSLLTVAALPASNYWLTSSTALAQDGATKLSEEDPAAKALGYVHDNKTVDKTANPTFKVSQICSNCSLSTGSEGEWRGCGIFPGKSVNENGWCKAWAAKPS